MARSHAWQELRALRATPPGRAGEDDRRPTYGAALRQAEELADAAAAADYAAKPLPLFYSLSQAGRAIAAARTDGEWRLRGHGLRVQPTNSQGVLATLIGPQGGARTLFATVAATTGSPPLAGPVALGELWAANPDLAPVDLPRDAESLPRALHFRVNSAPEETPDAITGTSGFIAVSVELPGAKGGDIEEAARPYSTLRGAYPLTQGPAGAVRAGPDDPVQRGYLGMDTERVNVAVDWPMETTHRDFRARERAFASFIEAGEPDWPDSSPSLIGYALPELAGRQAPHPLMLWWALLYGLSSLARYEPGTWTAALDLDWSKIRSAWSASWTLRRNTSPSVSCANYSVHEASCFLRVAPPTTPLPPASQLLPNAATRGSYTELSRNAASGARSSKPSTRLARRSAPTSSAITTAPISSSATALRRR